MGLLDVVCKDVNSFLKSQQELMFNERDLQMHLADWLRQSQHAYDDVDVEYYIPYTVLDHYVWKNELRLDIVVQKDGDYLPVELKYKTKSVHRKLPRFGEDISTPDGQDVFQVMKNQGAQDLGRYDFWKDVRRLELVGRRFKRVKGGLAVFLTNDDAYLKIAGNATNHYLFSMNEGSHVPQKHWQKPNSATAETHPGFTLEKEYEIHWNSVPIDGIEFHYCIVTI